MQSRNTNSLENYKLPDSIKKASRENSFGAKLEKGIIDATERKRTYFSAGYLNSTHEEKMKLANIGTLKAKEFWEIKLSKREELRLNALLDWFEKSGKLENDIPKIFNSITSAIEL
jgi:hypothetical protein